MRRKKFLAVLLAALLVLAALPTMASAAPVYDVVGVEVVDGTDGWTPVTAPEAGQKLTANIYTTNPDEPAIGSYPVNENARYKWYYKESPDTVLGTEAVYTATADNTNKTLCVEVSVNGYNGKAVWEAPGTVRYNVTGVEVVDGTDGYTPVVIPKDDQKLIANIKTDDPDNAVIGSYPANENAQYKWYYKESPDAVLGTEATYTVTEDNVDKVLCVEVSVNGYTGTAVWKADSVVTKPVYRILGAAVVEKDGVTPVTVPQVGDILTANIITSDFEDPVIGAYPINKNAKYRWHYEDSDNVLGTDPVYTVTSDNVGKTLCVEVSVAGYSGSAVWTAKGAVEEVSVVIPGDVNKDGLVDLLDMIQINNVINEEAEFDADAFKAADINADGLLDLLDMIQVNNIINSNI